MRELNSNIPGNVGQKALRNIHADDRSLLILRGKLPCVHIFRRQRKRIIISQT